MKKILLAFLLLLTITGNSATYYVKVGGTNTSGTNGTSEATAWGTLTYAATRNILPGDIIYIKAGTYGREEVVWTKSGTSGNPISIIGYKTTPGDQPPIVVNNSNPLAALVPTDMPTWTMTNGDFETFFEFFNTTNLVLKNLQCGGFGAAFRGGIRLSDNSSAQSIHTNIEMFNLVGKTQGNGDNYSGLGISLGDMGTIMCNYSKITKCLITNAGAEAISVFGDYNQITDCWTYCSDPDRIIDYHYLCTGSHNDYLRCKGEVANNFPALHQGTHGLSFKTNAEQRLDQPTPVSTVTIPAQYNTAIDCQMINIAEGFVVRHRGAQYNSFLRCKAYGNADGVRDDNLDGNCIVIRDGAANNTFNRMLGANLESAVRFGDSSEDGDTPGSSGLPSGPVVGHPSNNNTISNLVAYNCYAGIDFTYDPANNDAPSDAGLNKLENCSFNKISYMFFVNRSAKVMTYKNCSFVGSATTTYKGWMAGDSAATVTPGQFTNCNFFGNGSYPETSFINATTAAKAVDPLYVSASNLHLQNTSPIKNQGTSTGITVTRDYDSIARPPFSIGAYESAGSGSNASPTISMITPSTGATFVEGAVINIYVLANDSDGSVASVQFFVDGVSLGTDNTNPYSYSYTAVGGSHNLTAKATDDQGAQTTSSPVSIMVTTYIPPVVTPTPIIINYSNKKYYVSLTGNNSNPGTLAQPWRNLRYALSDSSAVLPGDRIYVKAGSYGEEQILCKKSGYLGSPIEVIGYKNVPGDQPPLLINNTDPYAIVATDMPTYTKAGSTGGYFIYTYAQSFINFRNLQCSNYYYGFSIESPTDDVKANTSITLFNCGVRNIGSADNSVYNGSGIKLGSMGTEFANNCKVIKCLVTNVNAEAIFVGGSYNQILDTKLYCNSAARYTDYWIMVNGSNNLVKGCSAERAATLTDASTGGQYTHGIGCKTNAEQIIDNPGSGVTIVVNCYNNKFIDCITRNIPEGFYVRHRGAQYNSFYNCKSYGNGSYGTFGNGITIRDGAANNTFEKILADNCASGARIFDSSEDGGSTGHANGINTIKNSIFINNDVAIYFPSSIASDAGAIRFYNNTFYKNLKMFSVERTANGCSYKNCVFEGGRTGGYFIAGSNASTVVGSQFTNCNFHDLTGISGGFAASTTAGTTVDPLFISPTDLHLQTGSTIKDNGVTIPGLYIDYDGKIRIPGAYSRGAYEK